MFSEIDEVASAAVAKAHAARSASIDYARAVQALHQVGLRAELELLLGQAQNLPAGSPADHEALGFAAFQAGMHELSRTFYARTVRAVPGDALAWYNLATTERNVGHLEAAEAASNRALELDPCLAQAALLRSHLRTQSAERNHVDELRTMLAHLHAGAGEEVFLHYALGKELDDLGEHDAAFAQFSLGAAARRRRLQYDVAQDLWKLKRIAESFDANLLADAPRLESPLFGFIVGLPRSGTTMIERIVTGNEQVRSNGETDNLYAALAAGLTGEGGDIFDQVAAADPRRVQAAYAQRCGASDAGIVLEKLPFNFLYAGAIRRTLPNARTLLVHRTPADNLLGMFSTLFGSGYPFSYSLEELADYFIGYDALIRHWRELLSGQLLEVAYESVVSDPRGQGMLVAHHFGVDWYDRMARIEKNATASATASAAQIRQPIYTSARGRWRSYERHLKPLTERLERAGIDPFQP